MFGPATLLLGLLSVIAVAYLYIDGKFINMIEEDFTNYGLNEIKIGNFRRLIAAIDRNGLLLMNDTSAARRFGSAAITEILSNMQPNNADLNSSLVLDQFDSYEYILDAEPECKDQWDDRQVKNTLSMHTAKIDNDSPITIIVIVRSAVNNYAVRNAIRQSWYLNKTVDGLVSFKTVFMVGACGEQNPPPLSTLHTAWSIEICKAAIHNESKRYGDIVQSSGVDNYYNNTLKTAMALRYVVERCPSDFTLTIDDDFIFEVDNFMKHIVQLASLERTFTDDANSSLPERPPEIGSSSQSKLTDVVRDLKPNQDVGLDYRAKQSNRIETLKNLRSLSNQYLYNGNLQHYVFPSRQLFDKWYISRPDYAYNRYPPFVSGGSVLMSFKTVRHFYLASYFTRAFIFDDVYLGMLAYRLGFLPEGNKKFLCTLGEYLKANPIQANATQCIGVHEIEPDQLIELWKHRKDVNR